MTAGLRLELEQKVAELEVRGAEGEPFLFLTVGLDDLKAMLDRHPVPAASRELIADVYVKAICDAEDCRACQQEGLRIADALIRYGVFREPTHPAPTETGALPHDDQAT